MVRFRPKPAWADRYVRNKLSEDQMADFEVAMLDSPAIQDEVANVLHIRQLLALHPAALETTPRNFSKARSGFTSWAPAALAASLLAALVSTALFVQSRQQANDLQDRFTSATAFAAQVLKVPVDIMRSAGSTPEVIVQKPAGASAIMLDIELPPRLQDLEVIEFQLRQGDSEPLYNWSASPGPDGRAQVVLLGERIPDGLIYLEFKAPGSAQMESRLLEFRAPRG